MSLQAYPKEGIFAYPTHAIVVEFVNHVLEFLLLQTILAQFPRNPSEILQVDVFLAVHIEEIEGSFHFLPRITIVDLLRRYASEGVLWYQQLRCVVLRSCARTIIQPLRCRLGYPIRLDDLQSFVFGYRESQGA